MVELVSSNWEVSDERRPNFADADSLDLLHKKLNNESKFFSTQISRVKKKLCLKNIYTGCLKIRELRIHSVVGDHFSSPNMEI
jgi:hypothetical protein